MAQIWIFLIFLFVEGFVKGSYENGIIITTIPKSTALPDSHHIHIIPRTPYDLASNESLYSMSFRFKKTSQLSARLQSCKVDYSKRILYLYDKHYARIEAIPHFDLQNEFANVTHISRVHTGVSVGYVKVAVDWVSHNIYWTDPMFRWIAMQPGDTTKSDTTSLYKIIVKDDLERPYALAVDVPGQNLFWSDISKYPKIERASLTGENRETIISTGLLFPLAIDVDVTGTDRRIYWVDTARDTVESANLTGGERRIIRRMSHTEFYDLALFRDVLSVVDVAQNHIYFINKVNGQDIAKAYTRPWEAIWGICMYHAEVQPAGTDYCATASCSDICVNEGGQAKCLCREGFKLQNNGPLCIEDTSSYHRALVISDGSSIYLVDIRSLTAVTGTYPPSKIYTSAVGEINLLALDMVERKVIFATISAIYSVAIDMSNPSAEHIVSSQYTITGLSIDWQDKNIYWTSGGSSGRISVVSQEGGNTFQLQAGLVNPRDLQVLALETKMVWISGTSSYQKIEISNLDGTQRETVVSSGSLTNPKSLEFDSHTNRLYYVDNSYIKRVFINGTELQSLITQSVAPHLFLLYQGYIAWTEDLTTDSSVIKTANVRTPSTTLVSGSFDNVGAIAVIAVLDASLQPAQKGPCEADNGECEHICIPIGRNRICKCEYGFTIDGNGRTCSSVPLEDHFILVADWSHNKIYQISLVNDEVRAVDIQTAGNPNAVIYRPSDKRLIWADTKDKLVHSSYLNGSDHKIIVNKGAVNSFVDRLAIDSTSGNLYYTSVNADALVSGFIGVSVVTPKGDNKDLVSGGYTLRDIVVDPEEKLMFWTDHGTVASVKKANMDGSDVTTIVSQNIKWPNGLAIDYTAKQLYISDGSLNTIQRCTYSGICSVINTDSGAHLMDIELSGQYLYYTAWNRPYITRMNKNSPSDISRLATNAELGRLDAISIYSSSATEQPVNEDCLPNNGLGDCSTICLPTQNGRTCACQDGVSLWPNSNICQDIPKCTSNIQNGAITGTCTFLHMAACFVSCDRFYRPAATDNKITCDHGQWNMAAPCLFSDTRCPESVDNVLFGSTCTYNNSEICTYSCVPGYTPSSTSETMTCDSGSWDIQSPCEELVPDCPTDVDKVSFHETCYFQNGEECAYNCTSGYEPTALFLICNGQSWNIQSPCRDMTCPESVDKVLFQSSCTYKHGDSCTYNCDAGYTPTSSDREIVCDSGTWDNQSPCIRIDCPSKIDKVSFPGTCTFQNDEQCAYSCASGSRPTGSDSRMTCIGGSWNKHEPCEDIKCPGTVEHVLFGDNCTYKSFELCTYSCSRGYTSTSSSGKMTCDNGDWNNQRPCVEIVPDCPADVDKVSFPGSCNFQNGENCTYSCTSGSEPIATRLMCIGDSWNIQEPCKDMACSDTLDKVEFEPSCEYDHGDSCTYDCVDGYTPTSSDRKITCNSGTWDNQSPCLKTDCPKEVNRVLFPGTCRFQNDEQCPYSCVAGSKPTVSDSRMTCIGGAWNIHKPCQDIKCPGTVEHVLFGDNCTYKSFELCTYSCSRGYTSTSSSGKMTCDNGDWNNQRPCVEIVPDCPADVDKVSFPGSCNFQNGENCTYSCTSGSEPIATRLMCIGDSWNIQEPCKDMACSDTLDKVEFEPSCEYDHGDSCTYDCVDGYTPTSSDRKITCNSGTWDNQSPCLKTDCPKEVNRVLFPGTCRFQNDEQCPYSCVAGSKPTVSDSRMTCIGGAWNIHKPCQEPITTRPTTTPTFSSTGSSTQQEDKVTPARAEGKPSVPVAGVAGGAVGGLILIAVVIVTICLIKRRSKGKPPAQENGDFDSPFYQGLDTTQTRACGVSAPSQNQRPDTTYDLIVFDKPEPDECGTEEQNRRHGNVYTTMAERLAPSGEYDTLNRATSDYDTLNRVTSDYLEPYTANKDNENFI